MSSTLTMEVSSPVSGIKDDLFIRNPLLSLEPQSEKLVDVVVVSLTDGHLLRKPGPTPDSLPNARILHFNYLTSTGSTNAPYALEDIAQRFLNRLNSVRSECPLRPIVFVGHHIGGLVIKMVLVSRLPSLASNSSISKLTSGVVFFCTPDVLKPESHGLLPFKKELERLTEEYYDFLALINRQAFLVHSFYEIDGTKMVSLLTSDWPADSPSDIIPGFPSKAVPRMPDALGTLGSLFRETPKVVRDLIQETQNRITARLDDTASVKTRHTVRAPQNEELLQKLSPINSKSILERNVANLSRNQGSWIFRNVELTKWLNDPTSQLLWLHGDAGVGKTVATTFLIQELISIQKLRDKIDAEAGKDPQPCGNLLAYFFCEQSKSGQQSTTFILSNLLHQLLLQRPDLIEPFSHRFKKWQEPEYFSSNKGLNDLWSLTHDLLHHHSVKTAYLVIDGLDECVQLRDDLLRLFKPYINGIPTSIHNLPPEQMSSSQASHAGPAPLHLRGGAGVPPLHPGARGPEAPLSTNMRRGPPLLPPMNMRVPPPPLPGQQFQLPVRPQINSTRYVDLTPRVQLTEEECRRRLTSYEAYSIRKAIPFNSMEKPTWAKAEVTIEAWSQEVISKQIKYLNESRLSVLEKKAALFHFQLSQVNGILDRLNATERDQNFMWSLAQIDRKEIPVRVGLKETAVLTVFAERSPAAAANPVGLFNYIERAKAEQAARVLGPPPSLRSPLPLQHSQQRDAIIKRRTEKKDHHVSRNYSTSRKYGRRVHRRRPVVSDSESSSWSDISSESGHSSNTINKKLKGPLVSHARRGPPPPSPPPPPASSRPKLTTKIGIFIASRNDQGSSQNLSAAREISINLSVEEQARRLIDHGVSKLPDLSQRFREDLKKELLTRAEGRLCWIKLAIIELSKIATTDNVSTFLDKIPTEFKGFYDLCQSRGAGLSNKVGKTILTFIFVAMRPLNFPELRLMTKLSDENSDLISTLESYVKATGYFLDISVESRIWFIHESAREFVRTSLESDQMNLESLHTAAAQRCFQYLSNPKIRASMTSYLHYPVAFWMDHGRLGERNALPGEDLSNKFLQKTSSLREEWFSAYWNIRYPHEEKPSGFTLPHILAESGYYQLLQRLQGQRFWRREDFNSLDSLGNLPLHWASRRGHLEAVEIILSVTDDLDRVNSDELTPLHFAAIEGHCKIAEQLISIGANINSKARNATTPLQSAASKGHRDVVRMLLAGGAFIDATNMDGYRAQHLARASGHIEIADLLRDCESGMISTKSLSQTVRIDGGFMGAVVDFVHPKAGLYVNKKVAVDKMLSMDSFDSIMAGTKGELPTEVEDTDSNSKNPNQRKMRWLHLPANNMRWVEILMNKHYRELHMPEAARAILRPEVWVERQHRAKESIIHGRFMRPGCQKVSTRISPRRDNPEQDSGILLTMPYLNWATEGERRKLNRTIEAVAEAKNSDKLSGTTGAFENLDRYERLVWTYLYDEHPLHIRRTLDQSYYSTLDNTEARDVDQIPYKYFNQHFKDSTMHPVLMVDQLWLWVLDKDTVLTSFPQRWMEFKKDDLDADNKTDVLETIIRNLDRNEAGIPDGYKLAELIINACASLAFTVTLSHNGTLPFPGCYETVIGQVADKETKLFREFTQAVAAEGERDANRKVKSNLKVDEKIFSIHRETKQLELIKDVRDELNMILMILRDQAKAVDEAKNNFDISLRDSIGLHESEIRQLDHRAEKVSAALKDLLDLKQKQANIFEARSQRHQAEETTTQGKAILLFTIITIIFLPLSFLASFFALQIVEFPKLTLSFVLRYMFPISAAISLPCILIALNFDTLSKLDVNLKIMEQRRLAKWWDKRWTRRELPKKKEGEDVEKALKGNERSREGSGLSQTSSGSSVLTLSGTSRRARQ